MSLAGSDSRLRHAAFDISVTNNLSFASIEAQMEAVASSNVRSVHTYQRDSSTLVHSPRLLIAAATFHITYPLHPWQHLDDAEAVPG